MSGRYDSRTMQNADSKDKVSQLYSIVQIFASWDTLFQLVIFGVMAAAFAPLLNTGLSGVTFGAVESLTNSTFGIPAFAVAYAGGIRVLKSKFEL